MAGIPMMYNSGLASSGAFSVAISIVSNQTQYYVLFTNPSSNEATVVHTNAYYGYQPIPVDQY